MAIVLVGLVFVVVLVLGWWMYRWQYATAERVLQDWAAQQQMTVLERTVANDPYSGPGHRYASNKQVVYRIKVKDKDGQVKTGIATIGSEKLGTLESRIEVKFDP